MNSLKISVVIPTYNRINSLKRVLVGLEKQTFPLDDFEVVVVSDGSNDGTMDYLNQLSTPLSLVPIQQENSGPAAARNFGISKAGGDIILFLDDDVVPSPQLAAEHAHQLQEKGEDTVVLGPMLTPSDFQLSPWVEWEQNMLVKQYEAMQLGLWEPTARQFYTGNSSLFRSHILAMGGFDPTFKRAEDVELAYRLSKKGLRFCFNPQAIGYHYAQRSFASWMSTAYAYGRNDVIFHQQKGQTWLLPIIKEEYYQRSDLIRALANLCVDHPLPSRISTSLFHQLALICHRLHLNKASTMALSAVYNLRYYQGIADQLGSWKRLFNEEW